MTNLIGLFHTVSVSPWREKYLKNLLCGFSEHQVFINNTSSRLSEITAAINCKLNSGHSRHEGLLYLETFLLQFPDDIFSQNAFFWASQALHVTEVKPNENNPNNIIPDLPFFILGHIIAFSSQFPAVVKQILPVVSKLLRQLTGYDNQKILADTQSSCALLECLQACMKHYSAQCVTYKAAIEKLLLGLTVSTNESIIHEASKCFILLSLINPREGIKVTQLIGGGNASSVYLYNQMLLKMLATMQATLNQLYENVPTFKMSQPKSDKLDTPCVTEENPVLAIQSSATIFINLCHYFSTMLTHPLPFAKTVCLEDVLYIVCQALAVTCISIKDQVSAESHALSICIPKVHIASLSILSALMTSSRFNLLSFGPLIIKLTMQSLKWTSVVKDWPSDVRKPYSSLRSSAYSCLSLWFKVSGSASCGEEVAEELISIALGDVVPSREKLTLMTTESKKIVHGKNRKRQKVSIRGVTEISEVGVKEKSSSLASGYRCAIGNGSANSDTCCAALETLTYLLYSVGAFLKPNQHKILQEKTVSLLFDMQRNSNSIFNWSSIGECCNNNDLIFPYQSDARCRLSLYKLLLALVLEPHGNKWPPPLGIAAKLFEMGFKDPNVEVSTFCLTSKRSVERLLHPCAPTLNFPTTISGVSDKQTAFLNSLTNHARAREYSKEMSLEMEEVILNGKGNEWLAVQESLDTIESSEEEGCSSELRSLSPEIITISDESPEVIEDPPSKKSMNYPGAGGTSGLPDPSPSTLVVLGRVITHPSTSTQETNPKPDSLHQVIGVQASQEAIKNNYMPCNISSRSDKVLLLRLATEGSEYSVSMKDFTQQCEVERNKESTKEAEDTVMKVKHVPSEENSICESGMIEGNENVTVHDLKSSEGFGTTPGPKHLNLESIDGMSPRPVMVEESEVPVVQNKTPVELKQNSQPDEGHVSESEEMMNCFVDAEPDSE